MSRLALKVLYHERMVNRWSSKKEIGGISIQHVSIKGTALLEDGKQVEQQKKTIQTDRGISSSGRLVLKGLSPESADQGYSKWPL
jgi:hypothetical protein